MVIAARSYLELGIFKVNLRTDENCSTLTYLDLAIAPSSITTESAFPRISGNNMKAKTVTSASMAMKTSSAQVKDTSSLKVYFFKESPAVLSTTTDSGWINTIKDSHNEFIKSYVDSKNYKQISDATSLPESEDTKGDGNNTSENTRSSGKMAISTLDPDNICSLMLAVPLAIPVVAVVPAVAIQLLLLTTVFGVVA